MPIETYHGIVLQQDEYRELIQSLLDARCDNIQLRARVDWLELQNDTLLRKIVPPSEASDERE